MSTTKIRQLTLADAETLQQLSVETFQDTFGDQNTAANMTAFLNSAYNLPKLEKELQHLNEKLKEYPNRSTHLVYVSSVNRFYIRSITGETIGSITMSDKSFFDIYKIDIVDSNFIKLCGFDKKSLEEELNCKFKNTTIHLENLNKLYFGGRE